MNTNHFDAVFCLQPNTIFLHLLRCTDLQGIDSIRSVSQAARVAVDANQTVVWTKIRRLLETAASWEREGLNLGSAEVDRFQESARHCPIGDQLREGTWGPADLVDVLTDWDSKINSLQRLPQLLTRTLWGVVHTDQTFRAWRTANAFLRTVMDANILRASIIRDCLRDPTIWMTSAAAFNNTDHHEDDDAADWATVLEVLEQNVVTEWARNFSMTSPA